MTLQISDDNRVRTLTLDRPDVLNAFNEALYEATAVAIREAAADPEVAVVLLTGNGRAFSAGNDLKEMQARITDPALADTGSHFTAMIDALTDFPKPLICAVNGLGVGIGTTILGYADLVFMSSEARLKCPFTSLGVAPEAASSYLLPQLVGRQNAAWLLMSSEWVDADEALRMGLVWRVCEPDELLPEARRHAEILAARPIPSLMAVKQTIAEPSRPGIEAATERENAHFAELMGAAANADALAAFTDKRGKDKLVASTTAVPRPAQMSSPRCSSRSSAQRIPGAGGGSNRQLARHRPRLLHRDVSVRTQRPTMPDRPTTLKRLVFRRPPQVRHLSGLRPAAPGSGDEPAAGRPRSACRRCAGWTATTKHLGTPYYVMEQVPTVGTPGEFPSYHAAGLYFDASPRAASRPCGGAACRPSPTSTRWTGAG